MEQKGESVEQWIRDKAVVELEVLAEGGMRTLLSEEVEPRAVWEVLASVTMVLLPGKKEERPVKQREGRLCDPAV